MKKNSKMLLKFGLVFFSLVAKTGYSEVIDLKIENGSEVRFFKYKNLISDKLTIKFKNKKVPVYKDQDILYTAFPAYKLFEGMKLDEDATITFKALDGFSAPLPKNELLNRDPKKSIAYVAIEDPKNKWPKINDAGQSAGPYYLIWKNPHLSNVPGQNWPFMLSGFEVKSSMEATYPQIFPAQEHRKGTKIAIGFEVFSKNCFACHQMNLQGASNVGPDLNIPMNPTEYFKESALKKLIRDPNSVRSWPSKVMYGFDKSKISDKELNHLIAYLKHMAKRKVEKK